MSDRRRAILEGAARVIARRGVRGLRVGDLAAEAGVSTALIYYHFKDRTGILRHALSFISDRADRYTGAADEAGAAPPATDPRRLLERILLLEFQDLPEVRENSTAWGELRAHTVFDPELRDELTAAGAAWVEEVAGLLAAVCPAAPGAAVTAAAERLTALLEGLSSRWLSGLLPVGHARDLMRGAIGVEIGRLGCLATKID
ncbi:TetR/AcrR family transcriptional regulator [Streptomyces sp. NBC_00160]|uniref:TetR/AcrR family transcriptional regulator n=1 Tax=Streptomyces sp. NBC_00160 TaxID=2903628 RepID=UPI0022545C71|nr:TetR/AcrR family transcriptional regulator [Streptomyces sp. NBC_00160]MCX5302188.1 TetR/AcrR family transcriptional regulator [Streptomyces sp. NBC_00160]